MHTAPAVIVTGPTDKRLARRSWERPGFEQSLIPTDDEPIYLVVTPDACDVDLERLARRFDVDVAVLQRRRDFEARR